MRKCNGNNTQEWGADAIFDVRCDHCGKPVEFFKDDITRYCPGCKQTVYLQRPKRLWLRAVVLIIINDVRNMCPKFIRSKDLFYREMATGTY